MFDVEVCPHCQGMWLDLHELDKLEDTAFADDNRKGSLIHFQAKTSFLCPHCEKSLEEFEYRLYNLKLDACTENSHGFWLDAGEDERVMEAMKHRANEIKRKIDAESEWKKILKNMHLFLDKK